MPFDWSTVGAVAGGLLRRLFRIKRLWIVLGSVLAVYVLGSSCSTYVPPNMIGDPAGLLRLERRHQARELRPGAALHRRGRRAAAPVSARPAGHQLQRLVERGVARRSARRDSIKIQTSDGYNVQLDVSIIYRIKDPYHVFTEAGPGRAFEDRLVIPRADRILRKTLGELNSEEFYQGPKRIEKAEAAHDQLVTEVAPLRHRDRGRARARLHLRPASTSR